MSKNKVNPAHPTLTPNRPEVIQEVSCVVSISSHYYNLVEQLVAQEKQLSRLATIIQGITGEEIYVTSVQPGVGSLLDRFASMSNDFGSLNESLTRAVDSLAQSL